MATEPPSTQSNAPSSRSYTWIFLFNYDPNNEYPFTCVNLSKFKGTDFPFDLISGHLGLEDRLKPRELMGISGQRFCLFAKVEEG